MLCSQKVSAKDRQIIGVFLCTISLMVSKSLWKYTISIEPEMFRFYYQESMNHSLYVPGMMQPH